MKSQKQCVYESVIKFFTQNKTSFKDGQIARELIDTEGRKVIHDMIFEGFKSGEVALKKEMTDDEIRKYIPGLLSNHLRKDTRLNGGDKYEAKNPGSMTGNSDPQIKNMRLLVKQYEGQPEEAKLRESLDAMVEAWKAKNGKKSATVKVDASLIPDEFKKYVA